MGTLDDIYEWIAFPGTDAFISLKKPRGNKGFPCLLCFLFNFLYLCFSNCFFVWFLVFFNVKIRYCQLYEDIKFSFICFVFLLDVEKQYTSY